MACSKYEYVKQFEQCDGCLPNCYLVVRVDGKSFHKFTAAHEMTKPNDARCLGLMTRCARHVMSHFDEMIIAYGQSDEYSFVLGRRARIYRRRAAKLATTVASLFAASFVFHWADHFPGVTCQYPPAFDGRVVPYPTDSNLRDYLAWRQADCHINNLYNTTFWTLVNRGQLTTTEAEQRLRGTLAADKNEILFAEFGLNYNDEPAEVRKGTTLVYNTSSGKSGRTLDVLHVDIIKDTFWKEHPHLLTS